MFLPISANISIYFHTFHVINGHILVKAMKILEVLGKHFGKCK